MNAALTFRIREISGFVKVWAIKMDQWPISNKMYAKLTKMMGHLPKQWAMKQNGWADELLFEVLDQNKFHVWIG